MHKKMSIIMVFIIFCSVFLCGCQLFCEHEWVDATCLAPKTCSVCALTEGELADHQWLDATCLAPKTCSICALAVGELADHQWLDADCTNPKTCAVCNITEGDPLEHTWTEATCTTVKTCSTCSATDGEPLGHSLGEPVIVADYVEATQTSTVSCTVCNEVCDTKISELERLHNGDIFLLSPQEFSDRFNNIIRDISPDCPYEVYYSLGIRSNEWSTWYIDEYLQKYNGNVVWRDENLSFNNDDEWRRMRFSAERYFNFETTYHISGTYYSYSIRWDDPIGVIAGMEINLKNNAYAKDLMIALLMTFVPDLTPDVAWNIITDEDALQYMNPVPFVHNGVGIDVSYYSSQTGSIHIWDEADVFSVAVYPLPEDSPYNVEHGIAYP